MKIENYLRETDPKHSHMMDSIIYAYAGEEAKLIDEYICLHVKKRPWWIPDFLYKWIVNKVLIINRFIIK